MSKRFTESEKWRDSWFRALGPMTKLAYIYILDNCDASGVWDPDFELADFQIGGKIKWNEVKAELGQRLRVLDNGKWFLWKFVSYQYGELTEACRPHVRIFAILKSHGIPYPIPYPKGIDTLQDKDKEEDKDKDKDNKGESEGTDVAEEIYQCYPKKVGKKAALAQIRIALKLVDAVRLKERVTAYSEAVACWPEADKKFVPDPERWFKRGQYDDDAGTWRRLELKQSTPKHARIDFEINDYSNFPT